MLSSALVKGGCRALLRRQSCAFSGIAAITIPTATTTTTTTTTTRRTLSSYPPHAGQQQQLPAPRAFPQYAVYGETCLLSLKLLMPEFKNYQNSIVLDKKGRLMLEWIPRSVGGGGGIEGPKSVLQKDAALRFAFSPEEIGLVLHQLPAQQPVVFSRAPPPKQQQPQQSSYADEEDQDQEVVMKVCRITPDPETGATCSFAVDYELNGKGGQAPGNGQPLEVSLQAGEMQVVQEIMRSSMPLLAGWQTLVDMELNRAKEHALFGRPPPGAYGDTVAW